MQPGFQGKPAKRKVIIGWELEQKMSDGRPFMLSKRYTLSLHEKATLRHDLESWRGQAFTPEELDGFDIEVLKGKQCRVNVIHKPKEGGGVSASIQAVMKAAKGVDLSITNATPPNWIAEERAKAIGGSGEDPDWVR